MLCRKIPAVVLTLYRVVFFCSRKFGVSAVKMLVRDQAEKLFFRCDVENRFSPKISCHEDLAFALVGIF